MAGKPDKYARRAFAFIDRALACRSVEEAGQALVKELGEFGYDFVTVWSVPPPGSRLTGIMLNTRPDEYVNRYVQCDYVRRDPVVRHMRKCLGTYSWSDVRASKPLSKQEALIIDEAREFGVRDGLIVPIVTATGSLAIVSPCGDSPDLSPRARSAVTVISMMGHQALRRLQFGDPRGTGPYEPLTDREREVMQFVAIGKTDSEIADILSLRPSTVLAHVENAKRKLGTAKRVTAVILALQRGEICL